MANLNHYVAVARFTRDPEKKDVGKGLSVFGVAVNNSRKNKDTGEWIDEPVFLDCEAWNQGEFGKLANVVKERGKKGCQVVLSGRLKMDQWEDKNGGGKRTKIKLAVDDVQWLDKQPTGNGDSAPTGGTDAPANTNPPADDGEPNEVPF